MDISRPNVKSKIDMYEENMLQSRRYTKEIKNTQQNLDRCSNDAQQLASSLMTEARQCGPFYLKSNAGLVYFVTPQQITEIVFK